MADISLVKLPKAEYHWASLMTTDKSTFVQVMIWCHQAISHYLSQCRPSSTSPYRNSNSTEISFWSHPSCCEVIAMKFCMWYDSFAVVACANFCSPMTPCNGVTLNPDFHQIWIKIEKRLLKWALDLNFQDVSTKNGMAQVSKTRLSAIKFIYRQVSNIRRTLVDN